MRIRFHPHARERMKERGATEEEVRLTVLEGERFPVKFGRTGFRRNFPFQGQWRGRGFAFKQVEALAVEEDGEWLVITVIVRFY
jgi:hypothetical protein